MLNNWLQNIKIMGIFLVCAQALIHFKPKGAYEKYIRLLVSIMLLVQMLEPVGTLLGFLSKGELQDRIRSMERKMSQIQEQSFSVGEEAEDIWNFLLRETELDLAGEVGAQEEVTEETE